MPKNEGRLIGLMPCENPRCKREVKVRASKSGFLYYACPKPYEGGCGRQMFSRDKENDRGVAEQITRWASAEDRKRYLGEPAQAKAPDKPADKPAADENGKAVPWWDREI